MPLLLQFAQSSLICDGGLGFLIDTLLRGMRASFIHLIHLDHQGLVLMAKLENVAFKCLAVRLHRLVNDTESKHENDDPADVPDVKVPEAPRDFHGNQGL